MGSSRPRAVMAAAVWMLALVGASPATSTEPSLEVVVFPARPTLLDRVRIEARLLLEFGEDAEFRWDSPEPGKWRVATAPRQRQRWQDGRVEQFSTLELSPVLPGVFQLPDVAARRRLADGSPGRWIQSAGATIRIHPPPAADAVEGEAPPQPRTDWPRADRSSTPPAIALLIVLACLLAAWIWRQRLAAATVPQPDAREQRRQQLLDEIARLQAEGTTPSRHQLSCWRRLLPGATADPIPEGLLVQADGLLFQPGPFDAETARTWASDLSRWLARPDTHPDPRPE